MSAKSEFLIADSFTDSLARLTGDEQKNVKTTAFDLQMNLASPGLKFHRIDGAKDKNFWSVRVNDDIRVIVHRTGGSLLLCYVDHHNKAYAWAERRKLEVHPKTGAAQFVEIRQVVRDVVWGYQQAAPVAKPSVGKAASSRQLFANIADDDLLSFGVPTEWLPEVRQANEVTLLELVEHLPAEAGEALLELATGGQPRKPTLQISTPPISDSPEAFSHPDAMRRFRVMTNVDELERALNYPWDKWTIFLHPEQKDWVERKFNGPARVSGSAGTGKTIVAIHRAAHVARVNPDSRVLLTTFSESLASALRDRLSKLVSHEPSLMERIDVLAASQVGSRLYKSRFKSMHLATRRQIEEALQHLIEQHAPTTKFSKSFILSEWEQVVDAWQLKNWEEYRDVVRLGRKTRLTEAQRKALWDVYAGLWETLESQNIITESQLFTQLAAAIKSEHNKPYEYIVVDESQDVTIAQMKFFAAVSSDQPNGLFFAGDIGQRIFQQPFSWKSLGVDIRGRAKTLKVNYRTSHQIRSQADKLLDPKIADVDGNEEQRNDTVSVFNGPQPLVKTFPDAPAEVEGVANWIKSLIDTGTAPGEIAIFVRSIGQHARAKAVAEMVAVPYVVLDEQVATKHGSVTISTMHLAKGLEFRAVAVIACDDDILPLQERVEAIGDAADLQDIYDTERYLLYVAVTRARDHLLVTGVEPASEFLEDMN